MTDLVPINHLEWDLCSDDFPYKHCEGIHIHTLVVWSLVNQLYHNNDYDNNNNNNNNSVSDNGDIHEHH